MAEDLRQSLEDTIKKFAADLDLPKVDVDKLIDTHERNLDSVVQTAVAATDAVRATAAKQRKILEAVMNDALAMAKAMRPGSDPKELLSRESEAVGHAIETAVFNRRDCGTDIQVERGSVPVVHRSSIGKHARDPRERPSRRSARRTESLTLTTPSASADLGRKIT